MGENYFNVYKSYADKYLMVSIQRLFDREELLGTDCLLFKNKDNPYDEMFGTSTTVLDRDHPIPIRLILNKSMLVNPFNHQVDTAIVYTADKNVELGNVIEYKTRTETVAYKVETYEEYTIDSGIVKRLTLSGYRNSG